jgi:preprotein translocase subunit SecD
MPIKTNAPPLTSEYLRSFTPYQLPQGVRVTDRVENMLSYDVAPTVIPINFLFGATDTYTAEIRLKNITTNVILTGTIITDEQFFVVSNPTATLDPGETWIVSMQVNVAGINQLRDVRQYNIPYTIRIVNAQSVDPIQVPIIADRLTPIELTLPIEIQ